MCLCVQVFVERGNEAEALRELESAAEAASWIQDLTLIVLLTLDKCVRHGIYIAMGTVSS